MLIWTIFLNLETIKQFYNFEISRASKTSLNEQKIFQMNIKIVQMNIKIVQMNVKTVVMNQKIFFKEIVQKQKYFKWTQKYFKWTQKYSSNKPKNSLKVCINYMVRLGWQEMLIPFRLVPYFLVWALWLVVQLNIKTVQMNQKIQFKFVLLFQG